MAYVLIGFGVTAYQLHRVQQLNQIDDELERRVAALSNEVRRGPPDFRSRRPPFSGGPRDFDFNEPPRRQPPLRERLIPRPSGDGSGPEPEMRMGRHSLRLSSEVLNLFDPAQHGGYFFNVWSFGGTVLGQSTNSPGNISIPARQARDTRTHTRMRGEFREAFHFTELGECILVGHSMTADWVALRKFTGWLMVAGGTVLAFGLGGGWWLTTRAIRPIERISEAASRISAGNLSERIAVDETENELGRMAKVLNSTFARLETAFSQQKQFTADASHELRTPLAVLISEAQTTLARERSADEYRETVEACLDTAQQMRRLTESLLELARVDAQLDLTKRSEVDLTENVRHCIETLRPLIRQRSITIYSELGSVLAYCNGDRIGQVITNLLANAIYYNKPGGEIRVSTRSEDGQALLSVSDTGLGISSEDLPHIFERFYRADKSRTRAHGRSGLGLAICKAILDADGGTISVTSQLGIGSTFVVRFPLQAP